MTEARRLEIPVVGVADTNADPNLVDTHIGATPWGWANHFGNLETAQFLDPLTDHE